MKASSMTKRTSRSRSGGLAPRLRDDARALYKNAILDAAEEEFAASGFHGARVSEIARRARMAVGTIYNHFPQKEDILYALLDERMKEMVAVLASRPEDPRDYEDKLSARLERVLAYRERHRAFFVVALEHGLLGEATAAATQILGGRTLPHATAFAKELLALVEDGVAQGALDRRDPELLAAFLKFTLRSVGRWARDRGLDEREAARTTVALFLRGAAPPRPSLKASKRRG